MTTRQGPHSHDLSDGCTPSCPPLPWLHEGQRPRPDGRYDCCPEGDEQPCPQRTTGHDLPCNAPYCSRHATPGCLACTGFRTVHIAGCPYDCIAREGCTGDYHRRGCPSSVGAAVTTPATQGNADLGAPDA